MFRAYFVFDVGTSITVKLSRPRQMFVCVHAMCGVYILYDAGIVRFVLVA